MRVWGCWSWLYILQNQQHSLCQNECAEGFQFINVTFSVHTKSYSWHQAKRYNYAYHYCYKGRGNLLFSLYGNFRWKKRYKFHFQNNILGNDIIWKCNRHGCVYNDIKIRTFFQRFMLFALWFEAQKKKSDLYIHLLKISAWKEEEIWLACTAGHRW